MNALDTPYEVVGRHSAPVQSLAVSSDGGTLLSGDTERQICLWQGDGSTLSLDLRTRLLKATTSDRIRSAAFSPDGSHFYVASGTTVQAFSTETARREWVFSLPRFLGFLVSSPLSLDVDAKGRIAVANDNGTFGIRDAHGRKMRQWKDNASPRWIRWMDGGGSLLGSDSFSIKLWDSETGEPIRGYETDERVYGLAASSGSGLFATRTLHSVNVYDVAQTRSIATVPTREGLPILAFSEDGHRLSVADAHGATVYGLGKAATDGLLEVEGEIQLLGEDVCLALAFDSTSSTLLLGCSDGSVRRYAI